jgi:dolichol-phosphate mannosyltransferase
LSDNALVVIPTYNEAPNVANVISSTLKHNVHVLIIDDNSTDGTKDIVRSFLDSHRVFMLERPAKLGLGTAYVAGFRWGLDKGYDLFFEMDADNSHNPDALPFFIHKVCEGNDMVVGSRYLKNTISVVGWDFKRLLLSKFGNWYASTLLGLKQFSDLTSGYRCYTRKTLLEINLDCVKSNGYAFQIEMVYRAYKKGLKITEISIIFYEREGGGSKMSTKIVREAVWLPFRLRLDNLFRSKIHV